MNNFRDLVFLVAAALLASCTTYNVGIQRHTGFTELPFPSNTYQSGQIVEVYSSPKKVEITFDPQIPWDMASTSEGWEIGADETNSIKSKFETEISKILSASASHNSTQRVQVEFTNTTTRLVPKNRIFATLDKAISEDSSLKRQLQLYMQNGTRFDVITQTLNANVSFRVIDQSNQEVAVDSEVIKKLNTDFDINFSRQRNSNRVISGSNLTVGVHYDPKMIGLLVK
ncbi:MAG: hypothetical protein U0998_09130 [Moraxellaceae bacterium]|nr:hypothetical protein [Moraxellaceae bacterium]MDZ4387344.1 hypothetical protein [Moraxellaceae bacterium]